MFAGAARKHENGEVVVGKPLYLQKHRLRAQQQTINVSVQGQPGHVGVDPRALLIDLRQRDNFVDVGPGDSTPDR